MIATIIILVLLAMNLGIALAKHGDSKGKYNFGIELLSTGIMILLYYYAGLFNNFK